MQPEAPPVPRHVATKDGTDPADDLKHFGTGAVRSSDAEQTRYDLISPIGLERIARTCAEGAKKYTPHNWERGMPVSDSRRPRRWATRSA